MESARLENGLQSPLSGEKLAQLFVYYRKLKDPYVKRSFNIKLVSGKPLYAKDKNAFDSFISLASKHPSFNVNEYVKFCIDSGVSSNESIISNCIKSTAMISQYILKLKQQESYKKIYQNFIKTVKNIVEDCSKLEINDIKDYLKYLIDNKLFGSYVMCGRVSIYFLAAIPKFNNIISKLDYFSQKELYALEKHFDIYHSDVNKAFMQERGHMVNPIQLVNKVLKRAIEKSQKHV